MTTPLDPLVTRTADVLKAVIAVRLQVHPSRLEVRVSIQPSDPTHPEGELSIRASVNIDGKAPSGEQIAQIDEILRAFQGTFSPEG